MDLFGRDGTITALKEVTTGVAVLVGESGVGKSSVLGELANLRDTAPTLLQSYDGALQSALIEQLGRAMLAFVESHPAADASEIAHRVGRAVTGELGRIVAKAALGYVKSKVGAEALESIENVYREVTTDRDVLLEARLTQAADADTIKTLVAICADLTEFVGRVTLYLDRADRLSEGDRALLSDLPELLPEGLSVLAAHTRDDAKQASHVRQLKMRGCQLTELQPLDAEDVKCWLTAEGLEPALVAPVMAVSDGYPLLVDACIPYLKQGDLPPDPPLHDFLTDSTRQSWLALEGQAREFATKLCAFSEPLHPDHVAELLGVDPSVWVSIRGVLLEARIFSESGSTPWFHERRRRVIWGDILNGEDRSRIAASLTPSLLSWIHADETHGLRSPHLALFASLASISANERVTPTILDSILGLSREQVAVMFSLVELSEQSPVDNEYGFVAGRFVQAGAEALLGTDLDAAAEFESLRALQLLIAADSDGEWVLAPAFDSYEGVAGLLGRCVVEFGRRPIIRAASAAFELAIREQISPFVEAHFGIGRPGLSELVKSLSRLGQQPAVPPSLVTTGSVGVRPIYVAATYASWELRDSAKSRITNSTTTIFGDEVTVSGTVDLPIPTLPAQRLLRAAQELSDTDLGIFHGSIPRGRWELKTALDLELRTREFARSHVTQIELLAADVEGGRTLAHGTVDDRTWIVEFESDDPVIREFIAPSDLDIFLNWSTKRDLEKASRTSVHDVSRSIRSLGEWTEHPIAAPLHSMAKAISAFNRPMPNVSIPSNAPDLQEMLEGALKMRHEDALAMWAAGVREESWHPPQTRTHFLVFYPPSPDAWGDHWMVLTAQSEPSDLGVYVRFLDEQPDSMRLDSAGILNYFGETPDLATSHGWSVGAHTVAELLGYKYDSISFWRPDSRSV
ncbi:ATP-binding protein [Aeromicrobium ginsengisoli]|uniref:ATP-binding protein n=1 Tax=Aeromicrobium ginsengisoli TaxID=363867 RepID=A0A5M4FER4_9ACTN|nr:ATP-binding protein [Aeromicrobium ginsengisoli]KAA1397845.1 ATP-binding protein [Aeromicrobium ginsengisoli]